ncbi:hypothetical protein LTR49_013270 [Elasticomyces elasticus]|nr:hypothetical protein LTR49_013270 [Elasticomyces elasticus]KAK5765669.1 hypothetical protein LTS12_004175 [Elasticomyces elasticus]
MAQPPTQAVRQAHRNLLKPVFATRDMPMLMDLPVELRDMIFTFALRQPEPIVAYVEQRTVPQRHPDRPWQFRPQPFLPPLALMKEEVSRDAFPIYLCENTFHFFLDGFGIDEVGGWKTAMERALHWEGRPRPWTIDIWKHLNIKLEFTIIARSGSTLPATIECSLAKDPRRVDLRFGGALESECTCWVLDGLDDLFRDCEEESIVETFAGFAERLLKDVWNDFKRMQVSSRTCLTCGNKEHYETVKLLVTLARLREDADMSDDPEAYSNALLRS